MCKGACKGICKSKKLECKNVNEDFNNTEEEPQEFLDLGRTADHASVEGMYDNNLDRDELHNNE